MPVATGYQTHPDPSRSIYMSKINRISSTINFLCVEWTCGPPLRYTNPPNISSAPSPPSFMFIRNHFLASFSVLTTQSPRPSSLRHHGLSFYPGSVVFIWCVVPSIYYLDAYLFVRRDNLKKNCEATPIEC